LCFVSALCVFNEFVDRHGSHRSNVAKALTQWWHPVASSVALDVLHWAMRPMLYHLICMVIKIASDLPALSVVVDLLLSTTIAK